MTCSFLPILKALADEKRFELVRLLLTHDLCVGALARRLGISEGAVSQHLRHLRQVGLVRGEKRGYWTHYAVERRVLQELAGSLQVLTGLLPCREGLCVKKEDQLRECDKEGGKMCDCQCQRPDLLQGAPKECTAAQIEECHAGDEGHPCLGRGPVEDEEGGEN